MRKLAETAEPLGYSIEPDGRVTGKGADGNASVVIWRSAYSGPPDAASYASLAAITSLGMAVVTADGVVEHTEIETVVRFIEDMFNLDEPMRERFEALRYRLIHEPAKLTGLMKRLAATRTQEQVKILGKFLVAIAAADGTIAEAEHRTLRTLFRGMGLSAAVLDETIVAVGVRLEGDQPIVVDQGSAGRPGEAIPRPPGAFRLDQSAIAALIEETEQVRGMLAEVFAGEEDEAPAPSIASRPSAAEPVAPGAESENQPEFPGLEAGLAPVLQELLTKPTWTTAEAHGLARRFRLMPNAVVERLNSWSEENLGDLLIEEQDDAWSVDHELVRRTMQ